LEAETLHQHHHPKETMVATMTQVKIMEAVAAVLVL
jgi:hypothetical protein